MREETACSVVRLMGIATVVVGVILTLQAAFAWVAFPEEVMLSGLGQYVSIEGMAGDVPRLTVLSNALIVVCGFFLCALSPALARYVARRAAAEGAGR